MTGEHSNRDTIITEWFFQEWIGDKSHLPEPEDAFVFMKIVIDIVSVFGELSEQKRKYIIGRAAVFGMHLGDYSYILFHDTGATQEHLDQLQQYQPDSSDHLKKLFQNFDQPHVKKTRMGIIYNSFRMLDADHKIQPEEFDTICMMAEKLDITKEQVQQLQDLYEEEKKLRQKRASLLFPRGFNDALIEYEKLR